MTFRPVLWKRLTKTMSQRVTVRLAVFFALAAPISAQSSDLDDALWLATMGEYQRALELFEASLRQEPDDPILNYYAGVSHYFLEDLDEARTLLQKAVEAEPGFPQAYYWLAQVLAENAC